MYVVDGTERIDDVEVVTVVAIGCSDNCSRYFSDVWPVTKVPL